MLAKVAGGLAAHGAELPEIPDVAWAAVFASPVAIAAYLADGSTLAINQSMIELLGHPIEVFEKGSWLPALFPDPEEAARTRLILARLSQPAATSTRHQRTITRSDGKQRLVHMVSTPFVLTSGQRGIVTMAFDLTNVPRPLWPAGPGGEGDATLASAHEAMGRFDARSARCLYVTPSIEPLTGFTPDEIYADPRLFRRRLHPESKAAHDEAVLRCLEGSPQWVLLRLTRKDGGPILLHQAFYPVRDASGRVVVVEAVARDVTAMKSLEAELARTIGELQERNVELASLDRLKSQLLSNVSHELRTPLVSIKGYTELLLREALGPITAKQRRGLEIAGASSDRLIELIETLLDFAHREEGRVDVKRARIDARQPIRDALGQVGERLRSRGIDLTVDLGGEPLEVHGDHKRLVQVLRALLSNAEKFSPERGVIRVSARHVGGDVHITVEDHGIGIPAAALAKVFDRFFQADSSPTRRFGGAGLGLALAREIILLHGGRIEIDSKEGKGSSFVVSLPAAAPVEAERGEEQPLILVGAGASSGSAMLHAELERAGFAVLDAPTGSHLLRRARRHRPDALVLAFPSPELDETLRALRGEADTHSLPLVALVDEGQRAEALVYADCAVARGDVRRLSSRLRRMLGRTGEPLATTTGRRPRIAVIDDEPAILEFTRFVLEREGFEVSCGRSGDGALSRIDPDLDLVILDAVLHAGDGVDLCRRIKRSAATRSIPVLVITARTDGHVRRDCFAAGADGFLIKPFGVDDFLRQVRLHVRDESAASAPSPSGENA